MLQLVKKKGCIYYMKRLKRNQLFFGTLLMMIFLLGTAVPALAGQTPGVLDCVEGDSVRGWAWNSSDPASAVEVKVTVTNQATGQTEAEYTAPADDYREDLVRKGTGTGNYGFEVIVPWETYEDGSYLVEAYASGMKLSSPKIHSVGDMQAMSSDGSAGTLRSLGVFKTTGYCPCSACSEGWGRHTSTGAIASANHTIAVDPRVIPYGSKIMINGVIYTAEDRGGAVKGNHVDIFFNTHGETRAYGTRSAEVFLVQ